MNEDIAILVGGLGKKYAIGGAQEKYLTMRDAIVNSVKALFVYLYQLESGFPLFQVTSFRLLK